MAAERCPKRGAAGCRAPPPRRPGGRGPRGHAARHTHAMRSASRAGAHPGLPCRAPLGSCGARAAGAGPRAPPERGRPGPPGQPLPQVAIKKMKRKFFSWDECMNLREVRARGRRRWPPGVGTALGCRRTAAMAGMQRAGGRACGQQAACLHGSGTESRQQGRGARATPAPKRGGSSWVRGVARAAEALQARRRVMRRRCCRAPRSPPAAAPTPARVACIPACSRQRAAAGANRQARASACAPRAQRAPASTPPPPVARSRACAS
jgi:hypothetical protein